MKALINRGPFHLLHREKAEREKLLDSARQVELQQRDKVNKFLNQMSLSEKQKEDEAEVGHQ